jgi:hypothetical protein
MWEHVIRDRNALTNTCGPEEMSMDLGIQGKTAIVTGGSCGIGRETALSFITGLSLNVDDGRLKSWW